MVPISWKEPGSSRASIRSRTVSLPPWCWRSTLAGPPIRWAMASRRCSSATSAVQESSGAVAHRGDGRAGPPAAAQCKTPAMSLVLVEVADRVATVTLNNPDERNTLTAPMVDEIVAAFDALEADDGVGAVVVTGTPPAFCAGANLGNLGSSQGPGFRSIYEGFLRVGRCPLPDARRRERRGRGRGDEPGARVRRAVGGPPGPVRHPVPADRHPPRRRPHLDAAAHRRAAGGGRHRALRRGARRHGGRTHGSGVALRRRRPAAGHGPRHGEEGGRRARASWPSW